MKQTVEIPPPKQSLSARSRGHLLEAMRGEAFAYAQYKMFARQARAQGHHPIASLFETLADEEYLEHFTELSELPGPGAEEQPIAGESHEADTMYKLFAQEALEDGDLEVAKLFTELRRDEAIYRLTFQDALSRIRDSERAEDKK
ncbi:MAG: rubrerythrin [Acidobacteriia bacterium]|nr:rubrerythrin [Terriglobia bacterium]